jgi:accessory gene regulator protein AgrB
MIKLLLFGMVGMIGNEIGMNGWFWFLYSIASVLWIVKFICCAVSD